MVEQSDQRLDLDCFRKAKRDIFRQLTGLGLIEEVLETRYEQPAPKHYDVTYASISTLSLATPDPIPVQVLVWRLTRRGEEQLALISGYRREVST
jgi:hypothetical protein